MGLYLGSDKTKLNLDGMLCYLDLFSIPLILNNIALLSSEDYILTDSKGIYLTIKEGE